MNVFPSFLKSRYPDFGNPATSNLLDGWGMKLHRANDAYHGRYPQSLRTAPGAPNDNVAINHARTVVDKSVGFLFGKSVVFNLDKEDTRSPNEKWLDDVFLYNQKDVFLQRAATNGGIYGHVFIKIQLHDPYPRLIVIDPCKVRVTTRHDDYTQVEQYEIRWTVNGDDKTKAKAYRQLIKRMPAMKAAEIGNELQAPPDPLVWTILDQEADPRPDGRVDDQAWITIRREDWPFPFSPMVACQNLPSPNEYWGQSDIEPDIIDLIEAINRSISNIGKIVRNHAFPKTVTIGLEGSQQEQFRTSADGVLHLPGDKTQVDIKNLEMQSDLASSLNYYESLRDALYETSRTPEVASGTVNDLSYLSAMAMQILYGPMMEKTYTKRATYGYMLIDLCQRLLFIGGKGKDTPVDLIWPDTFPRDTQIESQTAINKKTVGFSVDTLISELGGNPEYERERRKDDPVVATPNQAPGNTETNSKPTQSAKPPIPNKAANSG